MRIEKDTYPDYFQAGLEAVEVAIINYRYLEESKSGEDEQNDAFLALTDQVHTLLAIVADAGTSLTFDMAMEALDGLGKEHELDTDVLFNATVAAHETQLRHLKRTHDMPTLAPKAELLRNLLTLIKSDQVKNVSYMIAILKDIYVTPRVNIDTEFLLEWLNKFTRGTVFESHRYYCLMRAQHEAILSITESTPHIHHFADETGHIVRLVTTILEE